MRSIVAVVSVALAATCLLAADDRSNQNALTDKEKADGWVLLFDGKETKGWKVEGDAKVVDGVLVVGGNKTAKLKTTDTFGDFELRFEYRTEGKKDDLFVIMLRMPLVPSEGDEKDVWNELTLTTEGKSIRRRTRDPHGVYPNPEITLGEEPGKVSVEFEVPAGARLYLRNVKLKKR